MSFSRRTFLVGAGAGASVLVLAACTDPNPTPRPTPTAKPTNTLPAQSSFLRSNWSSDPYARGATSYLPVGGLPQARDTLREPIMERVFLAGEALADEPGTIRGAIDSGETAARDVLDVTTTLERVAVIGAGAAGSEAARVLAANGINVVVIEARDRTGGRIESRKAEDDTLVELGAWRLGTESDATLIDRLAEAGIDVEPLAGAWDFALATQDENTALAANDTAVPDAVTALAAAVTWAQQQAADVSVDDAVVGSGAAPEEGDGTFGRRTIMDQLLADLEATTGADGSAIGSWYLTAAIADPVVVPDGALSTLVDSSLEGVDTYLSTVVVSIAYDEDRVSLRLGTGESLAVDRVIVTVPLGVLQEQGIEFDPVLPLRHRSALDQLSVGDIELVRIGFDEPFWDTEAVVWFTDAPEAAVPLWFNLLPVTGENVLLGIVGGEAAIELAGLDDQAVLDAARASLSPFV